MLLQKNSPVLGWASITHNYKRPCVHIGLYPVITTDDKIVFIHIFYSHVMAQMRTSAQMHYGQAICYLADTTCLNEEK